jgi:acyl-CoA dehydrogenase
MLTDRRRAVILGDYSLTESGDPDAAGDFTDEVRDFLKANLSPDLQRAGRFTTGVHSEIGACRVWHRRLFLKGWIAPAWPPAFGGTGWSATRRLIFEQECARSDAPILFAAGLRSIGPLIIALGTPEQRQRFLPPILSGEDLWCQGFSEANAGSDLAALATRAVSNGSNYIVNGRKLWTTGAHLANRMFALVRTKSDHKFQEGITFLLIDMATPGITVRPIVTIDGLHEFNEVILDDVSVPLSNRIGNENEGWAIAKQLMRFARANNTNSSILRRAWRTLERSIDAQAHPVEPRLRMRLTEAEIELAAFESLELRLLASGRLSGDDEAGSSLMKLVATELHQLITELLCETAGIYGAASPNLPVDPDERISNGSLAVRKYLGTRAASIYSGTNEIHRNVLGKHLVAFGGARPGTG